MGTVGAKASNPKDTRHIQGNVSVEYVCRGRGGRLRHLVLDVTVTLMISDRMVVYVFLTQLYFEMYPY